MKKITIPAPNAISKTDDIEVHTKGTFVIGKAKNNFFKRNNKRESECQTFGSPIKDWNDKNGFIKTELMPPSQVFEYAADQMFSEGLKILKKRYGKKWWQFWRKY